MKRKATKRKETKTIERKRYSLGPVKETMTLKIRLATMGGKKCLQFNLSTVACYCGHRKEQEKTKERKRTRK
jgi:hypothetical protein